SVACRRLGPVPGTFALRLTYVVGNETRTLYAVYDHRTLAEACVLKFSLSPLTGADEAERDLVMAFLELGQWHAEAGGKGKVTVVSNAIAVAFLPRDKRAIIPAGAASRGAPERLPQDLQLTLPSLPSWERTSMRHGFAFLGLLAATALAGCGKGGETPQGKGDGKGSDVSAKGSAPAVKLVKLDLSPAGLPLTVEAPEGA